MDLTWKSRGARGPSRWRRPRQGGARRSRSSPSSTLSKATHNDGLSAARAAEEGRRSKATRAREPTTRMDVGSDATPGPGFGEDQQASRGHRQQAAPAAMRDDLAGGFRRRRLPDDRRLRPASGTCLRTTTARSAPPARGRRRIWYWTVDYGMYTAPEPPLPLDDDDAASRCFRRRRLREAAVGPWATAAWDGARGAPW